MSTCDKYLYINEDNVIEWDEMKNSADDTFINDATVTFTIKDTDDVVWNGVENVTMPYVAGSNGKYQGTLMKAEAADLVRGTRYFIEITADADVDGFRRIEATAAYHEEE